MMNGLLSIGDGGMGEAEVKPPVGGGLGSSRECAGSVFSACVGFKSSREVAIFL